MRTFNRIVLAGAALFALGSAASAADLIIEEPVVGVVDVAGDWDGFYIGAFVGGAVGLADHTNAVLPSPCAAFSDGCDVEISGLLAGLTAGANFYLSDNIIAGIAGDIAWSNVSGSDQFLALGPFESEHVIDWQGSVRGVLGFDAGAFMPYLTAGVAFAHATHDLVPLIVGPLPFSGEETHVGWTVGGGVAVAVADNVALDFQYRYTDFGAVEYDEGFAPFNPEFNLTQHAVTVGLNYQF